MKPQFDIVETVGTLKRIQDYCKMNVNDDCKGCPFDIEDMCILEIPADWRLDWMDKEINK